MPSRPLIALTSCLDRPDRTAWIRPEYIASVLRAGGLPVMLPVTEDREALLQTLARCDGLLLTGGEDVEPARWGGSDPQGLADFSRERDDTEFCLTAEALRRDLPLLAVCRGVQVLNAFRGGSLWIDLPTEKPSAIAHRQAAPGPQPTHTVRVLPETPLRAVCGREELQVNSLHHQAIRTPGDGLRVMAEAPDGVVEAVWLPEARFVFGVQWHPELMAAADAASAGIFEALVGAAKG